MSISLSVIYSKPTESFEVNQFILDLAVDRPTPAAPAFLKAGLVIVLVLSPAPHLPETEAHSRCGSIVWYPVGHASTYRGFSSPHLALAPEVMVFFSTICA